MIILMCHHPEPQIMQISASLRGCKSSGNGLGELLTAEDHEGSHSTSLVQDVMICSEPVHDPCQSSIPIPCGTGSFRPAHTLRPTWQQPTSLLKGAPFTRGVQIT